MSCIITYNGQNFTQEDFLEYLKTQISTKMFNSKQEIKPGVEELFESNPELANVVYEALGFGKESSISITPKANIPQNLVSGVEAFGTKQEANSKAKALLGNNPNSIDMIEAGIRTRTTRSVGEMSKYNVKVGDIVKQFGKSADGITKNILTRITAIHPKGSPEFLSTWEKEGWTADGVKAIERFKDGAAAIEFEVITTNQITPQQKQQAQQLYSEYLDTIFPDSKVKDIVYHGTGKEFNEFSKEIAKQRTGFHFTTKIGLEHSRFNFPKTNKIVILNIANPLKTDDLGANNKWAKDLLIKQGKLEEAAKTKGWDIAKEDNPNNDGFIYNNRAENEGYNEESYMVFEPEQIHILGSKQDVEGFKNWVDNNQSNVQQDFNTPTDIDNFAEEAFECK